MVRWSALLALLLLGCDVGSAPSSRNVEHALTELGAELGGREVKVLATEGGESILGARSVALPDTDSPTTWELFRYRAGHERATPLGLTALLATPTPAGVLVVATDRSLLRLDARGWRRIATNVLGRPAVLGSRLVISRAGDEPGQSDLVVIEPSGSLRTLAPAPGPDDLPIALPDGRVAFVSGRTGVASLWVVHPDRGAAEQLTNRGVTPGRGLVGFVPPPATVLSVDAVGIEYDDGEGGVHVVDHRSGVTVRRQP